MAENIFSGRYVWGGEQKENAVEEKSQVDNDKVNQGGDSGTLAKAMDNETESPLSGLLSIFDPNEKTKSGKLVPKGYLKSARNVVKTLKESLKEESSKESDVRRSADQAKEAIRDYLSNWKGQKAVESEESYKALEGVFRILGAFYAKEGPRAVLPSSLKSEILTNLEVAEAAL
ncbi:hypothetical protein KP509_1Z133300 [Ceratopteris richardii]|nr:hypothetical protein KP509_1Z133300 [Ceratopteris richardii]KAH6557124.1 hypothetical protein KP509_1Z133300 [Ceratopteris richardii]